MTESVETTTVPAKTSCTVQAQATPFIVHLNVPESEAAQHMTFCWEKAKATIPPQQWEGFRPGSDAMRSAWEARAGGLTRAYRAAWLDIIHQAARNTERFILDVQELSVERNPTGYTVASVVTFLPEVAFKAENLDNSATFLDSIPVEIYSLHPDFVAGVVKQRMEVVVKQHKVYLPTLDPVVDGVQVKLDIVAQLDGAPWVSGTTQGQAMVVAPKSLYPEELYSALLGKVAGDEFDVACPALPAVYGPDAGRAFTAHVKLVEVGVEGPEDATVWARAGYESEEAAVAILTKEVKKEMLDGRDQNKSDLALHYLRSNSTCGPIAMQWLRTRGQNEYEALIQRGPGNEQDVLKRHNTTSSSLKQNFMMQVADMLRDEVTILAFAKHHGQVNYSLDADKNFVAARAFLMTKIVATEVTPLSVRKAELT